MKAKRLLMALFAIVFTASTALAEILSDSCGDNATYTLDTETGLLKIEGIGEMENYNWSADAPWHSIRSVITKVEIADGITSIGNYAFSGCSGLTNITIPNSVTSIGNYAFWGCSGLTSVTIPNSVTSIGEYAFSGCSSLTSVAIPESVTSIGSSAFYICSSLTSVTIGNSVTSIGSSAFEYCSSLTSVTIGNSVTSIGSKAFYGCSSLTSVNIPESVTSIGNYAFGFCSGLTSVAIPNSVTSIGSSAFYGCYSLTSVNIPNSVTSIGGSAFEYCYFATSNFMNKSNCTSNDNWGATLYDAEQEDGLMIKDNVAVYCRRWATSVTIPNSVTCIGSSAFTNCSRLTAVTIPESVTSIGGSAFSGCYFATANFKNMSNCTSNYNWGATLYDAEQEDGLMIKDNVAVYCRRWATSVTIPNSVTSIESEAFGFCSGLTSVTIPNSVTSIGERAFESCSSLTSVAIPNSVTSIGSSAFYNCSSLTSVTIPNSVTSIGERAFYGCSSLTSPIMTDRYFIKLPMNYKGEYTIPEGLDMIGGAFYGCSSLTSVTIPNSVTSIGWEAFKDCSSLTSVTIPNSVTSIGGYAFESCSSLTSVTIPESVTSIGNSAFEFCSGLTSVAIPNSVTSIGSYAFKDCSSLTSVNIPNSVTSIGERAFESCSSLTSVTIPNSVKKIGVQMFYDCSSLTSVTIPNSVTSIGSSAFYGCSSLTEMTCEAIVPPTVYSSTFDGVPTGRGTLHVPGGSIEAYKNAKYWKYWKNIKVIVVPLIAIDDNTSSFSVNAECDSATYTRTYTGDWEALYVPFCVDVEAVAEEFDVAEIYNIHQYDENYDNNPDYTVLEIKKMTTGLTEPNTPYLIRAKHAGKNTMTMKNTTIYPEINSLDCSSVQTKYTFTGSYETSTISGSYTVQDGELRLTDGMVTPFRWYMTATSRKETPAQLPAKIKIMTVDDVIDGIESLTPDSSAQSGEVYDLQGRRIQNPTKGLYIQNGKKMLMK